MRRRAEGSAGRRCHRVGGRLARRQARHRRRHVRSRRTADWIARSVRAAPRGAGHCANAARSTGTDRRRRIAVTLGDLVARDRACRSASRLDSRWCTSFLVDRVRYVLEQRGFDVRNVRAVTSGDARGPAARYRPGASSKCCRSSPSRRTSGSWRFSSSACATSRGISTRRRRPAAVTIAPC